MPANVFDKSGVDYSLDNVGSETNLHNTYPRGKATVEWEEYKAATEFDYRVDNGRFLNYEASFGDSELDMKLQTCFSANEIKFTITAPDGSVQTVSMPLSMLSSFVRRISEINKEIDRLKRVEFTPARKELMNEINHAFAIGLMPEWVIYNREYKKNKQVEPENISLPVNSTKEEYDAFITLLEKGRKQE